MHPTLSPIIALIVLYPASGLAADLKPIILDPTYNHDRFKTQPRDIV